MTESEWLSCTDPDRLLEHVRRLATDRQFRLFICACVRRMLPWFPGKSTARQVCQRAAESAERFADGLATGEEIDKALTDRDIYSVRDGDGILAAEVARRATYVQLAGDERPMRLGRRLIGHAASEAAEFSRSVISSLARQREGPPANPSARKRAATIREKAWQVEILRDIFGNPFRPPSDLGPLPEDVSRLAEAAYAERQLPEGALEPARLAVLADALEAGGHGDADLREHLRSPGPHVRGCFAVDRLRGVR